jgi:hypothetical protein
MSPGDKANTWGTITNTNLGDLLEQAICGYISITLTSNATKTLTSSNYTLDEARSAVLIITGAITATVSIVAPTAPKIYIVRNSTSGGQSIIIKTLSGTGVTIANGKMAIVFCNGSGFEEVIPKLADNATTATTATTLIGDQTNWNTYRSSAVANMLGWKAFGNNHVIFDASAGTAPNGATVNKTNSTSVWQSTFPTLMGWNGSVTYGVRVDSARLADTATAAGSATNQSGGSVSATTGAFSSAVVFTSLNSNIEINATDPTWVSIGLGATTPSSAFRGSINYTKADGKLFIMQGTAATESEVFSISHTGVLLAQGESQTESYFRSTVLVHSGAPAPLYASALGAIQLSSSDERLKTEVVASLPGLQEVLQLKTHAFKWNTDIEERGEDASIDVGFFANETVNIIPASAPMKNDGYYSFNDRPIIAALVKAVQELSAKVTALEAK